MNDRRPPLAKCQACESSRIGNLTRLHAYLEEEEEINKGGVWISALPAEGSRLRRVIGGPRRIGEMAAEICADCGLVELYVQDCGNVPWGEDPDFQPMPESVPCVRCDSTRTGRMGTIVSRTLGFGFVERPRSKYLFFLPRTVEAVGTVSGVVCTDCGHLRTFVRDPSEFPWDRLEDFELLQEGSCSTCDGSKLGNLDPVGHRHAGLALSRRWSQETEGVLRAVVCTECGFFRQYLADLEEMPWESLLYFDWVAQP